MAILKMNDVKKLSIELARDKLVEIEKALLELAGEGKKEKSKPVRRAIARLKTYISGLERKNKSEILSQKKTKSAQQKMT